MQNYQKKPTTINIQENILSHGIVWRTAYTIHVEEKVIVLNSITTTGELLHTLRAGTTDSITNEIQAQLEAKIEQLITSYEIEAFLCAGKHATSQTMGGIIFDMNLAPEGVY
jgi:hypothetical protein